MIYILTSLVTDISLGITWWITKKVVYTMTYYMFPSFASHSFLT